MKRISLKTRSPNTALCFGSRLSRSRLLCPEVSDTPGPGEYYHPGDLVKKYPNKSGYTLLASKIPRDKEFSYTKSIAPPVGTYDVERKKIEKQSAKPFGIGTKKAPETNFLTPGPGTHKFFKREVRVCTSFGHDRIPFPLAQVICSQFNRAYCSICEETPKGDYWHRKDKKQDICRPCMEKQLVDLNKCKTNATVRRNVKKELQKFVLMRYCEFYHSHNCMKTAVQHMSKRELTFKIRKEHYFASYGF